jgi:hypothetical protein
MGRPRYRSRDINLVERKSEDYYRFGTPKTTITSMKVGGSEHTEDTVRSDHRAKPYRNADIGGPFDCAKLRVSGVEDFNLSRTSTGGTLNTSMSGVLLPNADVKSLIRYQNGLQTIPPMEYRTTAGRSYEDLLAMGATAIDRTIPTAPNVSVAQTLGELKEGLPSLFGKAILKRGDFGGEYLNYQFGIAPTISDIRAYAETARKTEEILSQWRRDSGRRVRRRYTFPIETSVTQTSTSGQNPVSLNQTVIADLARNGIVTTTTETYVKTWFSGQYRYYIPKTTVHFLEKLQDMNRLYGLVPDISTAWELLPFSWLIDWQSNMGSVISNAARLGQDGLALTYGYVMCHSRVKYHVVWKGQLRVGNTWVDAQVPATIDVDRKQRIRASPYGAGWNVQELSPQQIAILAALGLSRR